MDCSTDSEVLVKSEAESLEGFGCAPRDRLIRDYIDNGVVVVDKPCGPTSHQVSSWVRDMLGVERAGHSGTLDPKVTGVLPVALGKGTKAVGALSLATKEYVGVMQVHADVSNNRIKELFHEFTGRIHQKPPLKSAVKRALRVRSVYELTIIEKDGRNILFKVSCEAGTYIRKLVHDMGLVLGCGANMARLRRTRVGLFTEDDTVILQDLKDAYVAYQEDGSEEALRSIIHPIEDAVAHLKKIWVKDSAVGALAHGAQLMAPGITKVSKSITAGEKVALMTEKGEVAALAESLHSTEDLMKLSSGVAAKPVRVLIEADAYPSIWGGKKNRAED